MVGMDLLKFVDNRIKVCFLSKRQSEATCSVFSFISRYPAIRRHRTVQINTRNRTPTAHEVAHQCSEFMTSPVYVYTWSPQNSVVIKCMYKQCIPGAFLLPLLHAWERGYPDVTHIPLGLNVKIYWAPYTVQ